MSSFSLAEVHTHASAPSLEVALIGIAGVAVLCYLGGVVASRRRGRAWPVHRTVLWFAGVVSATAAVAGPLAAAAHEDFVAHMTAHLLVGMVAPLLMVLSAPVTLALRTLPVTPARRVSAILRSRPLRLLVHSVTAALLSIGGLWVLYLSPVFPAMREDPLVHLAVHAHLLLAGYVFTAAIIGVDPNPHPAGRMLTAVVLILAIAGHGILAKYLYASPPAGVVPAQVQAGAQLMYYAGAWVEAVIVVVFCARWYRAAGRSASVVSAPSRT